MNEYHGNHNHGNRISVAPMNSRVPPPEMSGVDGGPPAGGVVREQDQYMPIANVIRIMRRILPPHAKISDDAKETIQECVSEYISFVTGEANDRCRREQRKTVTAEDVLWAMAKLGFDDYVPPLTLFLNRHRAATNGGGAGNGGGVGSDTDTGGPKRATFTGAIVDPYGGFSPPAAAFVGTGGHFRHPHPYHGMFDPMAVYYPSGSGPSAGQNGSGGGYDPFAQYK